MVNILNNKDGLEGQTGAKYTVRAEYPGEILHWRVRGSVCETEIDIKVRSGDLFTSLSDNIKSHKFSFRKSVILKL